MITVQEIPWDESVPVPARFCRCGTRLSRYQPEITCYPCQEKHRSAGIEWVPPKEAVKLFSVSRPTLNRWVKEKLVRRRWGDLHLGDLERMVHEGVS